MTPFAHVAAGYLVTQAVDLINPGLHFNSPGLILTGIIGGNFPDLDILFIKDKLKHRNTITHAPIFWALIISGLMVISKVAKSDWFFPYALAFSLGIASHFFADWYAARGVDAGGIRLFYPFSKKHYGLFKLEKIEYKMENIWSLLSKDFIKFYMKNLFLFYSEVFLIILGLVVFLSRSLSVLLVFLFL